MSDDSINGLILNEWGKEFFKSRMPPKADMVNDPNFNDALKRLCESMNLTPGTIVEEGQMTACPVHYTYASDKSAYATQVVGTVLGTTREVVCNLLVVFTIPTLRSKTFTYVGRWCQNAGDWSFDEE